MLLSRRYTVWFNKYYALISKTHRVSQKKLSIFNKGMTLGNILCLQLFFGKMGSFFLEHPVGFTNKYQSGFRHNSSTEDHLFRLSKSVMESFDRGEHVLAAFLDVEKAFDDVWHNGLWYKTLLHLPRFNITCAGASSAFVVSLVSTIWIHKWPPQTFLL